jgi:hypothetical protein
MNVRDKSDNKPGRKTGKWRGRRETGLKNR